MLLQMLLDRCTAYNYNNDAKCNFDYCALSLGRGGLIVVFFHFVIKGNLAGSSRNGLLSAPQAGMDSLSFEK